MYQVSRINAPHKVSRSAPQVRLNLSKEPSRPRPGALGASRARYGLVLGVRVHTLGPLKTRGFFQSPIIVKHQFYDCQTFWNPLFYGFPTCERLLRKFRNAEEKGTYWFLHWLHGLRANKALCPPLSISPFVRPKVMGGVLCSSFGLMIATATITTADSLSVRACTQNPPCIRLPGGWAAMRAASASSSSRQRRLTSGSGST